jgi:hypothetical protein
MNLRHATDAELGNELLHRREMRENFTTEAPMPATLTPEAQAEIAALLRSLASLAGSAARAAADGILAVDEVIAIGLDVASVAHAVADLVRPNGAEAEGARVQATAYRDTARATIRKARRRARAMERRAAGSARPLPGTAGTASGVIGRPRAVAAPRSRRLQADHRPDSISNNEMGGYRVK